MALTQVSGGGIKDGQISAADLADGAISSAKFDTTALDTTYTLGAVGSDHYTFTGEGLTGAVNDPTLYLTRGKTYRFVNGNSSGAHPFRIQSTTGTSGTEYNTGVTNNAGGGGSTIIFEVPHAAPDVLYYQCTAHANMNGIFYVTGALADGTVTTAKLASSVSSAITANTNKTTNATHTGEVTGSTALTIADDVVDEANLKVSNSPTNGYFLSAQSGNTGGLTWANVDLTALSASNLTSGTIPDARFPATLPAISGANLTGIAGIPSGVIAIWSGATANIPSGWVICDGNNSTPDLRDRFVIGASAGTGDVAYPGISPGTTGGAPHTNTTVSVSGNTGWASQVTNASSTPAASPEPFNSRDRHQHGWGGTFTTSNFNIMPPYYALAFIMKT